MMRDVTIRKNELARTLEAVFGGDGKITRLQTGIYQLNHWNFEMCVAEKLEVYGENLPDQKDGYDVSVYGVCDSIEQVLEIIPKTLASTEAFCMSVVPILRAEQSESGGWRWHKWGPYIGTQKPEHEYLYDDKHIDKVLTYHIYKIL